MMKLKGLNELFRNKIFRVPDYQRGYAWQPNQLKDFWEDLTNLSGNRSHYTGVLTLKDISKKKITDTNKEYWLVNDHDYDVYHVVDGQQRLTTFVIFLQAFIEIFRQIDDNENKSDESIYIVGTFDLKTLIDTYLFKIKPTGDKFRTYKFGYEVDDPSYKYLKHEIFKEYGGGATEETLYTLNLKNAKIYFFKKLEELFRENGIEGLREIYEKITKRFLFNEYVIKDEFDVYVAFETMNNRGKILSDLELLKNRLIYLTMLYTKEDINPDERESLKGDINKTWKEVYRQLGRNYNRPLNDDDFLRAHWIMYFAYTRKKGKAYTKFLLGEHFSPRKFHRKIENEVELELPKEQRTNFEEEDIENENDEMEENNVESLTKLPPIEITEYVKSLRGSAVHWFNSHYPDLATELPEQQKNAIDRLNRIGMGYFRPLVMSFFKKEENSEKRIEFLNYIERFIFIVFLLCQVRRNYRDTEFYKAAREFDKGDLDLEKIKEKMNKAASLYFHEDGITLRHKNFHDYLHRKFNESKKEGFYAWNGVRYFLYEYELYLQKEAGHKKALLWEDYLKTPKDKVSIEHVFPQTPPVDWDDSFSEIPEEKYHFYSGSLGNLLLLSMFTNSTLQNDKFEDKKRPKIDKDKRIRNGYSDGSHSEIEVSQCKNWTPVEIEERGVRLLNFMEKRWNFKFENEEAKKELLFLSREDAD